MPELIYNKKYNATLSDRLKKITLQTREGNVAKKITSAAVILLVAAFTTPAHIFLFCHALVRYRAVMQFPPRDSSNDSPRDPFHVLFALVCGSISGLSRLGMLYAKDDHHDQPEQKHPDHPQKIVSLKYNAHQRGEDILYDMFYISVVGIYAWQVKLSSGPLIMYVLSVFPALIQEITTHIAACLCNNQDVGDHHINGKINILINILIAPVLSVCFAQWMDDLARVLDDYGRYNYTSQYLTNDIAPMVIFSSFFFRHALKKFISYIDTDAIYKHTTEKVHQCYESAKEKSHRAYENAKEKTRAACEYSSGKISNVKQCLFNSCSRSNEEKSNEASEETPLLSQSKKEDKYCGKVSGCCSKLFLLFSRNQNASSNVGGAASLTPQPSFFFIFAIRDSRIANGYAILLISSQS